MLQRKSFFFAIIGFLSVFTHSSSHAKTQTTLIWDEWYVVYLNKKTLFSYYHEKAEIKEGKVFFSQSMCKKNNDTFINESLGSFSKDNASLNPLFFNYRRNESGIDISIDGTVRGDKDLSIYIRKSGQEAELFKKSLPNQTIWVSHFPIWLKRNLEKVKLKKTLSFFSIVEDDIESRFATVVGRVTLEPEDSQAKELNAIKIRVQHGDQTSFWYLNSKAVPVRINFPSKQAIAEKITKEKARSSAPHGCEVQ